MIKLQQKDIERFWSKVSIQGSDDCWEWEACIMSTGYGHFHLKKGV